MHLRGFHEHGSGLYYIRIAMPGNEACFILKLEPLRRLRRDKELGWQAPDPSLKSIREGGGVTGRLGAFIVEGVFLVTKRISPFPFLEYGGNGGHIRLRIVSRSILNPCYNRRTFFDRWIQTNKFQEQAALPISMASTMRVTQVCTMSLNLQILTNIYYRHAWLRRWRRRRRR